MCMCFCFVSAHGFVSVFCMPCALISIVLTPPFLFPDYWWICPTSLPSLPSSFAPFIISLCLQYCPALSCPALPSLVASCLVFPFTLQKYRLHLFTFCRTDGRSVNVLLFRCVQMFCSGHVRSFHSSPCQRYTYIHIIHNSYTLKYNLIIQWCKSELSSAVTLVFRVMWSFRNHSNILIYYQCWKQFCCLIFIYLWHFVQDYLMNRKLKRTAVITN